MIAASDGRGIMSETIELPARGEATGSRITAAGEAIGFARTPGYETYRRIGLVRRHRPEAGIAGFKPTGRSISPSGSCAFSRRCATARELTA